jgi:uncharacterized membrane protein (DUF4010 family)
MMYLRIDVVVAIFNPGLARVLLPPLLILFALAVLIASWQWRHRQHTTPAPAGIVLVTASNPLQLGTALTFALLFVVAALASAWVSANFGRSGVYGLAALTGTTDINPFVLNLAQGGVSTMPLPALATAILIAVASNNMLNAAYALLFGGIRACLRPALVLFGLGAIGLAIALLYLRPPG